MPDHRVDHDLKILEIANAQRKRMKAANPNAQIPNVAARGGADTAVLNQKQARTAVAVFREVDEIENALDDSASPRNSPMMRPTTLSKTQATFLHAEEDESHGSSCCGPCRLSQKSSFRRRLQRFMLGWKVDIAMTCCVLLNLFMLAWMPSQLIARREGRYTEFIAYMVG